MRLGLVLPPGEETAMAAQAEQHGLFGVLVRGRPGREVVAAAYAAQATGTLRIIVQVPLGSEHPVTLAEELAVLDNISNGRLVVLADTAELSVEDAEEDLGLLRKAWAGRPLRHVGHRWVVPAGNAAQAGRTVMVTPAPAQVQVPVWLTGSAATPIAERTGLPTLTRHLDDVRTERHLVQPAEADLQGSLEVDRATAISWAEAGATHLLLSVPPRTSGTLLGMVSRYLAPEVGMSGFPRVIAESPRPKAWPTQ